MCPHIHLWCPRLTLKLRSGIHGILGIRESETCTVHARVPTRKSRALSRAPCARSPHRLHAKTRGLRLPCSERRVDCGIREARVYEVGRRQPQHRDAADRVGLLALELAEHEVLERLGEVDACEPVLPVGVVELRVVRVA